MSGTAIILSFAQLKGLFGMKHFTHETSVQAVIKAIIKYKHEVNSYLTFHSFYNPGPHYHIIINFSYIYNCLLQSILFYFFLFCFHSVRG